MGLGKTKFFAFLSLIFVFCFLFGCHPKEGADTSDSTPSRTEETPTAETNEETTNDGNVYLPKDEF